MEQQEMTARQFELAKTGEAEGQCAHCGSYRADGKPPVLHRDGCPHHGSVLLQEVSKDLELETNWYGWWSADCSLQREAERRGVPTGLRPTITERVDRWVFRWEWQTVEPVGAA